MRVLLAFALAIGAGGCKQAKQPTPASDLIAEVRALSAKACACKDAACIEPLLRAWNALTAAAGGGGKVSGGTFTAEQVEALAVEDERMMKCAAALGAGAGSASGAP